jgi:hypothetical protein
LEAPETTLPASTPPKVLGFFELVRRELIAEGKLAARSSTTVEPSTAPTTPAPTQTTEPPQEPNAFPLGLVAVSASAVVAVGGAAALFTAESMLAQPMPLPQREDTVLLGRASTVALSVGLVAAGLAGALWAVDVLP